MSHFVVSARKYRPTSFKDIVSQPHITTTLKNAIAYKQLAHAFLFCGPRGVGKTTCARVLSKAINCLQVTEEIEPCNHCTTCLSFNTGSAMNVYEVDAASNNSVEDIRDLVDQIRYVPQIGKYKIYIIDEVHMLSSAAFNAFLKTLEEPPSYAIFILATTERHKVIPTILSRCQIFNFNRIKLEDIETQLKTIAIQESIAYEASALQLIAQKAEGAMRDALSMFDRIATSVGTGGTITYTTTRDHLQILDYDYYFKCTAAFLKGDIPTALCLYDTILRAGFNGHHFLLGLGEHLRNLLVCKDSTTIPLLEVTDNIRPRYAEHASSYTMPFLLRALTLLNQCEVNYKASPHQRLHVELLLIELADRPLPATEAKTNPSTLTIPTLQNLKEALLIKEQSNEPVLEQIEVQRAIKEPIMKDAVQAFLADYGQQLKKNGNIAGYHLINQSIEIQDQTIIIPLINSAQVALLQNLKETLVPQMRQKLNDAYITIQGSLVQQTKSTKPYTDQEKLTYLSKKNAAIALIQKRFRLEVAY